MAGLPHHQHAFGARQLAPELVLTYLLPRAVLLPGVHPCVCRAGPWLAAGGQLVLRCTQAPRCGRKGTAGRHGCQMTSLASSHTPTESASMSMWCACACLGEARQTGRRMEPRCACAACPTVRPRPTSSSSSRVRLGAVPDQGCSVVTRAHNLQRPRAGHGREQGPLLCPDLREEAAT